MKIDWLDPIVDGWRTRAAQDRVPHAVLLIGPRGVGKRATAAWMARDRLGMAGAADGPAYPLLIPEHADLRWIAPVEDKETISIEQIRELVSELSLTSYEGGGKVAVIEPANAMTISAANSLLKTLEEPPGDALLVLVADRVGRLPATILSRCQRVAIPLPAEVVSLGWLNRWQPADSWREVLRLAGEAPLAALEAAELVEQARVMLAELVAVGQGMASPVEIADKWSKLEPGWVLNWLAQAVQRAARGLVCGAGSGIEREIPDSVLCHMDTRNMFCYLDTINRLRGQQAGSFNLQLTLESLLIDWAGGLRDSHRWFHPGSILPTANTR